MILRTLLLLVPLVTVLPACTTNPATGEEQFTAFMSPGQEMQVGAQEHAKIVEQYGIVPDRELGAWVAGMGTALVRAGQLPQQTYTFTVLDTDLVNAFALPGGYVYLTRGLIALAENEAQVAAVLAHELGHVAARHSAERYSRAIALTLAGAVLGAALDEPAAGTALGLGSALYLSSFSRAQESQADRLAIDYLHNALYDPFAMAGFLAQLEAHDRLQQQITGRERTGFDFFATHPDTPGRIEDAVQQAQALPRLEDSRTVRDRYLDAIDGMIFGGSAKDGYVRGREFLHPELRISFVMPEGFAIVNTPQAVLGIGPGDMEIIFDLAPQARARDPLAYLTREWTGGQQVEGAERLNVNGLAAATGVARREGERVRLVAIAMGEGRMARFLFAAGNVKDPAFNAPFQATALSFRRLGPREAAAARPLRIAIRTVRTGETVESIAAGLPLPVAREGWLRLLNGLTPQQRLQPGERIKIVVEGYPPKKGRGLPERPRRWPPFSRREPLEMGDGGWANPGRRRVGGNAILSPPRRTDPDGFRRAGASPHAACSSRAVQAGAPAPSRRRVQHPAVPASPSLPSGAVHG